MLLGQKKTQGDERNWCVVLNPIASEIEKKKIAQRLSEVFPLSEDEARDLVENTPIILLDHLPRLQASKVKDYFEALGAKIFLTSDVFQKRKYYRTVWPVAPNLSFLQEGAVASELAKDSHILGAEEALHEIQALSQKSPSALPTPSEVPAAERKRLLQELERWKKSCQDTEGELARMQGELQRRSEKDSGISEKSQKDFELVIRERERDLKELRALLGHAEERYEVLKEEYQQARSLFEEKLGALTGESGRWKKQAEDNERSLSTKDQEGRQFEEEKSKMKALLDQGMRQAAEAVEQWKKRFEEEDKKTELHEKELREAQEKLKSLQAELEQHELLERKVELVNLLAEKEAYLRGLVKEQERIEVEIRVREEAIRKILAEQEVLEKEIIDGKQAERHLMESLGQDSLSPRELRNPRGSQGARRHSA